MTLSGTVVNGVVVLDPGSKIPEGTRVFVDIDADLSSLEYPHPMAPYDLEKEVALLKASHDSWVAGEEGQTLEEFREELRREFDFLRSPAE